MIRLSEVAHQQPYVVVAVHPPLHAPEWQHWLEDIGFIAGESVLIQRSAFGGDPLAVRIGTATFALRLAEAACIEVRPSP